METEFLIRFDYAIKHILRDKANFGILEGFIEVFLKKKCKIMEILEIRSGTFLHLSLALVYAFAFGAGIGAIVGVLFSINTLT